MPASLGGPPAAGINQVLCLNFSTRPEKRMYRKGKLICMHPKTCLLFPLMYSTCCLEAAKQVKEPESSITAFPAEKNSAALFNKYLQKR